MPNSLHPELTIIKIAGRLIWKADFAGTQHYHLDHATLKRLTALATGQIIPAQDRQTFARLGWLKPIRRQREALSWQKLHQDWHLQRLTPLYLTRDVWIGYGFSGRLQKHICCKISRKKNRVSQHLIRRLPKFCCLPLAYRNYGPWRVEILPYRKAPRLDVWRQGLTILPEKRLFDVARKLIKTLAALHARGIVHGDFHPGNLLLFQNQIVVLDFEFSRFACGRGQKPNLLNPSPRFLAPEAKTQALTFASDIYVLAKTLLFLQQGENGKMGKPDRKKTKRTWQKLLRPYLAQNPLERPSLAKLKHDILALQAV